MLERLDALLVVPLLGLGAAVEHPVTSGERRLFLMVKRRVFLMLKGELFFLHNFEGKNVAEIQKSQHLKNFDFF